jgi:hypothetical protein
VCNTQKTNLFLFRKKKNEKNFVFLNFAQKNKDITILEYKTFSGWNSEKQIIIYKCSNEKFIK